MFSRRHTQTHTDKELQKKKIGSCEDRNLAGWEDGGKKKVALPKWNGRAAERIWKVLCLATDPHRYTQIHTDKEVKRKF
jgi:hypothetical protein